MGHLVFEKIDSTLINVYNKKKEYLGFIEFDDEWKKVIWTQDECIKMDKDCLSEVIIKLEELQNALKHNN